MITERARYALHAMVQRSLCAALTAPGDHIDAVEAVQALPSHKDARMVMLAIASYAFRLILILHRLCDASMRQADLARPRGVDPESLDPRALNDAFAERGNLCCGMLNRELGRVFPHLGMSTPHMLDGRCVDHLASLEPDDLRHFRLTLEGRTPFHATLWVKADGHLDFEVPREEAVEATGELELL